MNKKGFTLVEVLVASVIMVAILIAWVTSLTQASNLINTIRQQDIALNAAQYKLEAIKLDVVNVENYGNLPESSFSVATLPGIDQGSITVTDVSGGSGADIFEVTVTINWTQRNGREVEKQLTTALVKP